MTDGNYKLKVFTLIIIISKIAVIGH